MRNRCASQKVALKGCVKYTDQSLGASLRGKRPFRRPRLRWEIVRVYECIAEVICEVCRLESLRMVKGPGTD
jgi:hypothetical protein